MIEFQEGDRYFELNTQRHNKVYEYIRKPDGLWVHPNGLGGFNDDTMRACIKYRSDHHYIVFMRGGDIIL